MNVCFVFGAVAEARPEARWTITQLAPLLDAPWRIAAEGSGLGDDEVIAYVGDAARAPAGAAAVIPVGEWPRWDPATLGVAAFDRSPLVCLAGSSPPPASEREMPAAWLRSLFFLLSREEEMLDLRRDSWECYSGRFTRLNDLGVLGTPLVHAHADQLRRRLDAGATAKGRTLPRVPRWKGGARFAAALSHDVDDVQLRSFGLGLRLLAQGRSIREFATREALLGALRPGPDPYSQLDRWAAEEERRGFRSTFYVFAPEITRRHRDDAAYRWDDRVAFGEERMTVTEVFRRLHARGFEIGLHGSYLSHRDGAELAKQKRATERHLGAPVTGTRQHFLRFDPGATWRAQEEAGFACDSTLGYNETPGFRAGIAAPFHPWDGGKRAAHRLLELPLTCMDGALLGRGGLGLAPDTARAAVLDHLDRAEAAGGVASLLWHPNAAAGSLFPGWWACWIAALDRLKERGAWVATAGEIAAWWGERSRGLAVRG